MPTSKATKAKAATPAKRTAKPTAAQQAARTEAIVSRGLTRDAESVAAQRTNFNQYSDRDTAYLTFFGGVMRKHGGKATLAQIHAAGTPAAKNRATNPNYSGSAKATDAGAINRLVKAGYITASADGQTLTATDKATSTAAYLGKA